MLNILRKISHHLISLRLDDFSITGGLATLRNLLFEYGPKMNQLVLNLGSFTAECPGGLLQEIEDHGGALYDDISGSLVPKLQNVPSPEDLKYKPRPRLTCFRYRAKPGTWFPLQWLEVFMAYPNLQVNQYKLKNY